jgi:GDP-L-fucose synthase
MSRTRILITGGSSMIGRAILDTIDKTKYDVKWISGPFNSIENGTHYFGYDLTDCQSTVELFEATNPDVVLHLAGLNGGIAYNAAKPFTICWNTIAMAQNVLKCAVDFKCQKVVSILASCSYPDLGEQELQEKDIWNGASNPSVECHGMAKRYLYLLSRQAYKEHGLNAVSLIMNNCFGLFDRFDQQRSKVVGGMIKRFVEAKEQNLPEILCWGDGSPKRELLYAKDAAKLILLALDKYDDAMTPLNIGSMNEITIKELAETIKSAVEYYGNIVWDTSKPNGQMRKKLDLTRMNDALLDGQNFPYTIFHSAIKDSVDWYIKNKDTWTK